MNRGDIYWVNLEPTKGGEIKKTRPCVIMGATPINQVRRTILVIPLSTSAKPRPPIVTPVNCLGKKVVAVCDQLRAIDKSRLLKSAGELSTKDLELLDQSLRQVLAL